MSTCTHMCKEKHRESCTLFFRCVPCHHKYHGPVSSFTWPRVLFLYWWQGGTHVCSGPIREHNTSGTKIRVWLCSCTGLLDKINVVTPVTNHVGGDTHVDITPETMLAVTPTLSSLQRSHWWWHSRCYHSRAGTALVVTLTLPSPHRQCWWCHSRCHHSNDHIGGDSHVSITSSIILVVQTK